MVRGSLGEVLSPLLSQRPRNISEHFHLHSFLSPLTSLNFTSFFFSFFASSWLPLGFPFEPFWRPSWVKFGPSCLLAPYFFENMDFQKNEPRPRREHDFGDRSGPRSTQDGSKIASRRSSRVSFFVFVFVFDFGPFLLPFWVPCWVPFWNHLGPLPPPC